ncbi:hypothetical protein SAY87_012874 [Trapa incisa]|uniref:F-box domain-containing protein n=2 Tax=Trapa TaxID=22665 RepID=A0AAN7K8X2_TRANT|nr:hypothetical protein SAY86_008077 [Trapa natans]KAK4763436.1 hypothetical protein SAY87_012874 [Trapa incisa]
MEVEAGQPHEALFLVLPYLPLYELLATAQVCKSLRYAVHMDVLLYLDLAVQQPLSRRLSDDILIKFTRKAGGRLRALSLSGCFRITDDGLLRVVQENPLMEQLYLPDCTSLTPQGVENAVKILTSSDSNNLKRLKINGIYNLAKEHIQTLKSYLDQKNRGTTTSKSRGEVPLTEAAPIFFHDHANTIPMGGWQYCRSEVPSSNSIDVEVCPKCHQVRMVFDCPRQEVTCRECRGCIFCIPRCADCGICLQDAVAASSSEEEETEEAVCGDFLCFACWVRGKPKCRYCNRPYCRRHWKQQSTDLLHTSDGFLCGLCKYSEYKLLMGAD